MYGNGNGESVSDVGSGLRGGTNWVAGGTVSPGGCLKHYVDDQAISGGNGGFYLIADVGRQEDLLGSTDHGCT